MRVNILLKQSKYEYVFAQINCCCQVSFEGEFMFLASTNCYQNSTEPWFRLWKTLGKTKANIILHGRRENVFYLRKLNFISTKLHIAPFPLYEIKTLCCHL